MLKASGTSAARPPVELAGARDSSSESVRPARGLLSTPPMSEAVCLIGDDSGSLRGLMRDTLADAGFLVIKAESSAAFATQVHDPKLMSAAAMLLVLGERWASQCAVPISVAATMRQQSNLPPTCVVLLYELGTLGMTESSDLHHCRTVAMLEKPFGMDMLREVVQAAVARPPT